MKKMLLSKSKIAVVIFSLAVFAFSCKKSDNPIPASPVITAVTTASGVASGPKNTEITIKGSNFTTNLSMIQVTVNGKACTVLSATLDSIKAKLPPYCGSGNVVVTINGVSFTGPFFTYIYTYTVSSLTDGVVGYTDGPLATAKFEEFVAITIDGADNIYTSQYRKPRVRKISADGIASTMAGDGTVGHVNGNGTSAKLGQFDFCSSDPAGNIFVAQENGYIRKIDVNKNVTDFYTFGAGINPFGIKVMPSGNVYFHAYDRIGKISPAGVLTWLAISNGTGDIDGPVASARFYLYGGVEVSADESKIYVSQWITTAGYPCKVKVLSGGTLTTIAGDGTATSNNGGAALSVGFSLISCTLLDNSGGLYIAEGFNSKLKYLKDGQVTTIIGAPGAGDVDGDLSVAKINYPHGLAMDSKGNLYISNVTSNKLKKLTID